MQKHKVIREYGTIYPGEGIDSFNEIFLDIQSFDSLKNFIAENNDPKIELDHAFSVHRKKGLDFIKVKNYVGVIETKQGTVIEILPKIFMPDGDEIEDADRIKQSKLVLFKMLKTLWNSPFRSIDQAHLKISRMPIFEVFISAFLTEVEKILKKGIKHQYNTLETNEKFLKGKLKFSNQIRLNLVHKERFFVEYDEFRTDIPQNRILKSALVYLQKKSKSPGNKAALHNYIQLLDEVGVCNNLDKDLAAINGHNRLFSHYDTALKWAKVFLLGQSFTSYRGMHLNTAILFPMQSLFESYVSAQIRKNMSEVEISFQDRQHWLVTDKSFDGSKRKFRMRPDIVIRSENEQIVADTKWKIINQYQPSCNYNITSADMYQLFAYGKNYQKDRPHTELLLIYPKSELFDEELCLEYDSSLKLRVMPYDLTLDPSAERIHLLQYFPQFQ